MWLVKDEHIGHFRIEVNLQGSKLIWIGQTWKVLVGITSRIMEMGAQEEPLFGNKVKIGNTLMCDLLRINKFNGFRTRR
jgi:hypothetical protein